MPNGAPFGFAVSGQTDANGNASINVYGLEAGVPAAFNLSLDVQGNAPFVQILQGGLQLAAASAVNGNVQIGSVITDGSSALSITIVNALANTPIAGMLTGIQSSDPQDLAAITGQTSLTIGTVTAYDGQTLIGENNVVHTADSTFPLAGGVYDVRLWASVLLGLRLNTGGPLLITFRWYANPDGTRLVGQRSLILNTDVVTAVATIPNLGPYLQMVVNRITGGSYTWNASLLTSQRIVADIYGGNFTPFLVEAYSVSVAASTTVTFPFGTLYGGAIRWSVQNASSSPGNLNIQIESMGTDGAYHSRSVDFPGGVAPGGVYQNQVIVPATPCLVSATTAAGGTSSFSVLVWASPTGGS